MKYNIIIRKRVKYIRVYTILNRLGPESNMLTKFLMRLASKLTKNKSENL